MINEGIIKLDQILLVYSQPPEEALIGVVDSIEYPIVNISVIERSKINKFGRIEKIDLSKNLSLTILTNEFIERYLTSQEIKRFKKIQKDRDIVDLFSGSY